MNNQDFIRSSISVSPLSIFKKHALILIQFFLIIFVYHTLKDLKDSIVITASDAGAEVIPFIKIWAMLPIAVGASYLFAKLYNRFGREKTLYVFICLLLGAYILFAFVLYPFSSILHLSSLSEYLKSNLPSGCKGFIAMISYWHYTFFYLMAELWSLLILSILFWSYVNSTTTLSEATKFYPLCMFVGNFAGIISGQTSHYMSQSLTEFISWESSLQLITCIIVVCGLAIMGINRILSMSEPQKVIPLKSKKQKHSLKDNIVAIFESGPLICIATLVVGFGITSSLIEIVWKENIRNLYPSAQAYNAYINQLTSMIGLMAVIMSLISRWMCQNLSWTKVALITPTTLFATSIFFFAALMAPAEMLAPIATFFSVSPIYLIVFFGSIHYVLGLTAKYTIFDMTKEMAFLSIEEEERIRAKSVIDSIGSRLGKSGASCLYQFLLIAFGSTSGHISIIGISSICMIGISILATKRLGRNLKEGDNLSEDNRIPVEALAT
ncbi:MAG: hypothetical protein H0W50_00365 [Parachlamydiaceae bacterium]|nr:hypothetical protein [Parachlamydiaceae bacterium]